jgi:hypothetical protein
MDTPPSAESDCALDSAVPNVAGDSQANSITLRYFKIPVAPKNQLFPGPFDPPFLQNCRNLIQNNGHRLLVLLGLSIRQVSVASNNHIPWSDFEAHKLEKSIRDNVDDQRGPPGGGNAANSVLMDWRIILKTLLNVQI